MTTYSICTGGKEAFGKSIQATCTVYTVQRKRQGASQCALKGPEPCRHHVYLWSPFSIAVESEAERSNSQERARAPVETPIPYCTCTPAYETLNTLQTNRQALAQNNGSLFTQEGTGKTCVYL